MEQEVQSSHLPLVPTHTDCPALDVRSTAAPCCNPWIYGVCRLSQGSLFVLSIPQCAFGQMYDGCMLLWYHTEQSHCPKRPLPRLRLFIPTPPQLLATTDRSAVVTVLLFPECHVVGTIRHVPPQTGFFRLVLCISVPVKCFCGLLARSV